MAKTKADRIRQLDNGERTEEQITKIIVKEFGSCGARYVYTVLNHRIGGRSSEFDIRYRDAFKRKHGMPHGGYFYRKRRRLAATA